jgi:molecular chaperone DnaJ
MSVAPCARCGGRGSVVKDPCRKCRGQGRTQAQETVEVEIPAGVSTGNYIPKKGLGSVGPQGGPAGDLIVFLEERPHEVFERDGDSVLCDVEISFSQAALGTKLEVPSLRGTEEVKVSAGTQSGSVIRISGKGIRSLHGHRRGDQLVRVHVRTPSKLSARDKELLEELSRNEKTGSGTDAGLVRRRHGASGSGEAREE